MMKKRSMKGAAVAVTAVTATDRERGDRMSASPSKGPLGADDTGAVDPDSAEEEPGKVTATPKAAGQKKQRGRSKAQKPGLHAAPTGEIS